MRVEKTSLGGLTGIGGGTGKSMGGRGIARGDRPKSQRQSFGLSRNNGNNNNNNTNRYDYYPKYYYYDDEDDNCCYYD